MKTGLFFAHFFMQNIFLDLSEAYRREHHLPELIHAFIQSNGNSKTGRCIAHYAIPYDAIRTARKDADSRKISLDDFHDTCGHCALRTGHKGIKCYVLHGHFPRLGLANVIQSVSQYKYDSLGTADGAFSHNLFDNEFVRFGAFGEGADLGEPIVEQIASQAFAFTAYTRKWMMPKFNWAKRYFQASTFSDALYIRAENLGFNSYRLLHRHDDLKNVRDDSSICPASKEANRIATCRSCGLCNGKNNIHINSH